MKLNLFNIAKKENENELCKRTSFYLVLFYNSRRCLRLNKMLPTIVARFLLGSGFSRDCVHLVLHQSLRLSTSLLLLATSVINFFFICKVNYVLRKKRNERYE